MPLDIEANRRARKWSTRALIARTVWEVLSGPLFAWTPRPLWAWRCAILRLFGANIGKDVHVFPTVKIAVPWNLSIGNYSAIGDGVILYALGPIKIGERATVSQYAHLCAGTHDWRDPTMPLIKAPIVVGDDAWLCANAFIGPGVTIGDRAIVGAAAVTMKDVAPGSIVGGNPAREIGQREV
jgi:putative colanic acid biosynthesis acetyltransferase WcaF